MSTAPPAPAGAIRTGHYATTDADQGHAFIRQMYVDCDMTIHGDEQGFAVVADTIQIGSTTLSRVQHSMAIAMDVPDGVAFQAIVTSRRPTMSIDAQRRTHRLATGDAVAFAQHVPYHAVWEDLDIVMAGLDPALVDDVAAAHLDPGTRAGLTFGAPVSPVAAQHWQHTLRMVRRIALANTGNLDGHLLADDLSRLLATAALTCFPNPTLTDTGLPARSAGPASLQRAVSFIEDNLHRPITLTEIGEAARVSPRALAETFQRHLGTSPMAYTRRARLARAHQDLQAAQPGDGQTVTSIATRWGFHSLPRFGVTYRQAYQQPPSQTLRTP